MTDERKEGMGDGKPAAYDSARVKAEKSFGDVDADKHWAAARAELNRDELDFLRERSQAPGVADGGALRNHYCMNCNGVIPLEYDSSASREDEPDQNCPHCGESLEGGVRMMFNWVEIDQIHGSDARALMPFFILGFVLIVAVLWWALA